MSKSLRRTVVVGSVAAVAAAISITAINMSSASQPGDSAGLTAVSGNTIKWDNNTNPLTVSDNVGSGGAWSPDGSRFAYISAGGVVKTVRWNKGSDIGVLPQASSAAHPTWTEDGSGVVWASGGNLMFASGDTNQTPGTVDLPAGTYSDPDGGPGGIVFTAGAGATSTIQHITEGDLFSTTTLTPDTVSPAGASQPALSPDGTRVAFVMSDGTHNQIYVTDEAPGGGNQVQVTSDAADHTRPTWSPDGSTIAFDEGTVVKTAPSDGSGAASPTTINNISGPPAYQSTTPDTMFRVFGPNRFETAVAASEATWDDAGSGSPFVAQSVVLTRSDTFADALAGSALAAAKQGPLLLTPPTSLNVDTANEIKRVLGTAVDKTKTVYILGSTAAISAATETTLAKSYTVKRLAGANRFATAVQIADAINPNPGFVLVGTGQNFPDALSAGAAAGAYDVGGPGPDNGVVILTNDEKLPVETKTYLDQHAATATYYAVGTQAENALGANGYDGFALAGSNRYITSAAVADVFFPGANLAGVAIGTNWPDALGGGAMMGSFFGPMVLTSPTNVQPVTSQLFSLSSGAYTFGFAFGSSGVLTQTVLDQLGATMSGPDGADQQQLPFGAAQASAKRAMTAGGKRTANVGRNAVHRFKPDTSSPLVKKIGGR